MIINGKEALIFSTPKEVWGFSEWKKMGKPLMLVKMDSLDGIDLYEDYSYGEIYLMGAGRLLGHGKDFATVVINHCRYVALSESYGVELVGLYKKEVEKN